MDRVDLLAGRMHGKKNIIDITYTVYAAKEVKLRTCK
jgi:hypothetical protein